MLLTGSEASISVTGNGREVFERCIEKFTRRVFIVLLYASGVYARDQEVSCGGNIFFRKSKKIQTQIKKVLSIITRYGSLIRLLTIVIFHNLLVQQWVSR